MKEDNKQFENVTHYTHVDVQPGGINIQHVENLYQADFLKALGVDISENNNGKEDRKDEKGDKKVGPRIKQLFPTNGDAYIRNDSVTKDERDRFLKYLKAHNLSNHSLTTESGDTINEIVVCFWLHWKEKKLVSEAPQGSAIFRFLTEECGLSTSVQEKSYANKIVGFINNKRYEITTYKQVGACFV